MGQEKLKPMMDSIRNYRNRPLNDFVDVMSDVLYDKQQSLLFLFGISDAVHFKNSVQKVMKNM